MSTRARFVGIGKAVVVIASMSLLLSCREIQKYGVPSILCAEAMRIYLDSDNPAKVLRFNERDNGNRAQILFELENADGTSRRSAAACAFGKDESQRTILIGASFNGERLASDEITRLSDMLLRGTS
jgi:hypothetical protein